MRYILVHGTFATSQIWTLARALWANDGSDVEVEDFDWSGNNKQLDRERAGGHLAERIDALRRADPHVRLCLIGHSHGGNVCFHALDFLDDVSCVHSIVTMGTPFLTARPRDSEWIRFFTSGDGPIMSLILFIALLIVLAVREATIGLWIFICVGPFFIVLYGWYLISEEGALKQWYADKQNALKRQVAPTFSQRVPTLVCVVRGDEAYAWLRSVNAPSRPLIAFANVQIQAMRIAGARFKKHLGVVLVVLFRPPLELLGFVMIFWAIGLWLSFALVNFLFIPVALVSLGVCLQFFFRAHRYGFGDLGIVPLFLFDISASRYPPPSVPSIVKSTAGSGSHKGLRHSSFYNDPELLGSIHSWNNIDAGPLRSQPKRRTPLESARWLPWVYYAILLAVFLGTFVALPWIFKLH